MADLKEAKLLRKNIRAYNRIFSLTLFGVKLHKDLASFRRGIFSFKAQGQVYHDPPSFIPKNDKPCYFQLYFNDKNNKLVNRISLLQDANLSEGAMRILRKIMEKNKYAKFFSQLKEHTTYKNLEICIVANALLDQRVYNRPSVYQVPPIWVDSNNPNIPFGTDIALHENSGNKNRLKHDYLLWSSSISYNST